MAKSPDKLIDEPQVLSNSWEGYQHEKDPTLLPFNTLTFPSRNCSIPDFDTITPDLGKTLKGQAFTENVGIIGNKEKFSTLGGIETEVRVFASANANLKDVIQVGFFNTTLTFNTLVGAFQVDEFIYGTNSGASAKITQIANTTLYLTDIQGEFQVGETITGGTSLATAVIVIAPQYFFYQLTENLNPLPRGVHEYYFDEWFDTNSDTSNSKNLPRLIWVNGYATPTNTGEVYSWTGGIAIVTNFVANTSITTDRPWIEHGFSTDATGNAYVVINGISIQLTNPADLLTNTITVASTAGVALGAVAFSQIETDAVPIPFDVCRMNKNYMFYGNWKYRDLYQSNFRNRPSRVNIVNADAVQNDMVLSNNASYTGTGSHIYRVTIDSITPPTDINTQQFVGTGTGNGIYDTSAYSGGTGLNEYKLVAVTDYIVTGVTATMVPPAGNPAWVDQVFVGGTSGAYGIAVGGQYALSFVAPFRMISGIFLPGETLTGQLTGATVTVLNVQTSNHFQFFKNGVQVTSAPFNTAPWYMYQADLNGVPFLASISLVDGITFTFPNPVQCDPGDYYELIIHQDPGGPDTFQWQVDNGNPVATGVTITGGNQTLQLGIVIKFISTTGHAVGDFWDIQVNQEIDRAWVNYYYTLPRREPQEGYVYKLPSSFWAMDTQEESMYINSSYGEWGFVSTVLSGDLQSEDVSFTPLKQTGANKVIYPYMTGHINDDLVFVSVDKNLNTIGRKEFLEKPQTGYLSEPVRQDFLESSFKLGRIKYIDKKLYISSPLEGITHCYDTFKKYWQPPKTFTEVGILSIIGNNLVAHSHVRNQTFTMFTNTSGDNGQPYDVVARTAISSAGDRWHKKESNMSFIEGYIDGAPPLVYTIFNGVGGCAGVVQHNVQPIKCVVDGDAPLGQGVLGSHPLGNDPLIQGSYFQEIYKFPMASMRYYFTSFQVSCSTTSHTYKILSLGINTIMSPEGNNPLVNALNKFINPN